MKPSPPIFDGHLDLAMNALCYRRDLTQPIVSIRQREAGTELDDRGFCTVTLDEMRRGGVRVCVSTLIARAKPWVTQEKSLSASSLDWPTREMAAAVAHGQLAYYRELQAAGHLLIVKDRLSLLSCADSRSPGVILTMEGADPIVEPEDLKSWHKVGLRSLMLAHFGKSHYAHGTPAPAGQANEHDVDGPLSPMGQELLDEMRKLDMPLDLTHTSDRTFADAVEYFGGAIYSSHTACRSLCDIPRNHSDAQLKSIFERKGVVGVPLYNRFLTSDTRRRPPLDGVVDHVAHLCSVAGSAGHVAIGSDLDGGFGRADIPEGLDTIADLGRIGDAMANRGFSDTDIHGVLYDNWLEFWKRNLPA
ncbi:MAG: peptidase [Phycisphaera sp.]|nr:peptidase [Phycisphaera sp.]